MSLERRRRVLVVEDEVLVAMLVEDMLAELGCEVAAVSSHLAEGLELARSQEIDFAILDVNVNGQPSFAIAEILRSRQIPFVFATGYGEKALGGAYVGSVILQKPFQVDDLARAIAELRMSDLQAAPSRPVD